MTLIASVPWVVAATVVATVAATVVVEALALPFSLREKVEAAARALREGRMRVRRRTVATHRHPHRASTQPNP
jgi:hypothetical protein